MYNRNQTSHFNAFDKQSFRDYQQSELKRIHHEIFQYGKEYIVNVDENEFVDHLVEKHTLEQLKIIEESEEILKPTEDFIEQPNRYGERTRIKAYSCSIKYFFNGSGVLFGLTPTRITNKTYPITINYIEKYVIVNFKMNGKDPNKFNTLKKQVYDSAFANIVNVNENAAIWNNELRSNVQQIFSRLKQEYLDENTFFEAIKVNVNDKSKSIFTVPSIQKTPIVKPPLKSKTFSSEPSLSLEIYKDALKVIHDMGKSMERKPSTYRGKSEEDIRDFFITLLESRYVSTTTTGETFNKQGKTDILIKYEDGTNLFVAECKVWHGISEYFSAIDQLFERYLTWRDSKTAVVLFVKNNEITNVLDKIREETKKHQYFLREVKINNESSFSYIFHLPGDKNREVYLEVMAFHFNQD